MLRQYPCPSCGFTVDSWAQHRHCPRCSALLPEHEVDMPVGDLSGAATESEVDFFQRRARDGGDFLQDPGHVPWWAAPGTLVALATLLALLLVSVAAWMALDADGDGLSALDELRAGTSGWDPDTDGDRLADGWETGRGTDPASQDSDGDTLNDLLDLRLEGDPLAPDTDGDGLSDAQEAALANTDCDGDGATALRSLDDDGDGRRDADEPEGDRCRRDSDADGVRDGDEGNALCVRRADCDGDGLRDGDEGSPFDPLDPDTLGVGLPDAVTRGFTEAGLTPSRDVDRDGIPDVWEEGPAPVDWGKLVPATGERDLLVEVVRVVGPATQRTGTLEVTPALEAVRVAAASLGDIRLTYTLARVDVGNEPMLPAFPTAYDPVVADILAQTGHATDPFTTTVLLVPQSDQARPHTGGAALRGMLAAVDLGAHTVHTFTDSAGNEYRLTPAMETLVQAGQGEALRPAGYDRAEVRASGEVAVGNTTRGWWLAWEAPWFQTAPRLEWANGTSERLRPQGVAVDSERLAATVLHELGHTLGLCHLEDEACRNQLPSSERSRTASSVMSASWSGELGVLPGEWARARTYLGCPPVEALALLASHAPARDILQAKYAYASADAADAAVRQCGKLDPVPRSLAAGSFPPAPRPPGDRAPELAEPTSRPLLVLMAMVGGSFLLSGVAGLVVGYLRRPQPL